MSAAPARRGSRGPRTRRGLLILAVIATLSPIGRVIWATGVFSTVPMGFPASCKVAAPLPGVDAIETVNGQDFVRSRMRRQCP